MTQEEVIANKLLEKYKFNWPRINSKYIEYVLDLIKGE